MLLKNWFNLIVLTAVFCVFTNIFTQYYLGINSQSSLRYVSIVSNLIILFILFKENSLFKFSYFEIIVYLILILHFIYSSFYQVNLYLFTDVGYLFFITILWFKSKKINYNFNLNTFGLAILIVIFFLDLILTNQKLINPFIPILCISIVITNLIKFRWKQFFFIIPAVLQYSYISRTILLGIVLIICINLRRINLFLFFCLCASFFLMVFFSGDIQVNRRFDELYRLYIIGFDELLSYSPSMLQRAEELKYIFNSKNLNVYSILFGKGSGATIPSEVFTFNSAKAGSFYKASVHNVHIFPALVFFRYGILGLIVSSYIFYKIVKKLLSSEIGEIEKNIITIFIFMILFNGNSIFMMPVLTFLMFCNVNNSKKEN